jgi:hypothetical protein
MRHQNLLLLVLVAGPILAQSTGGSFESIQFQPTKISPTFTFSNGRATSDDPIRITVPGRNLTESDRVFRTSLQKYWLSQNVPKGLEVRMRTMNECNLKMSGEYPYCDLYSFVDPKTGKLFEYYIYIGNWP